MIGELLKTERAVSIPFSSGQGCQYGGSNQWTRRVLCFQRLNPLFIGSRLSIQIKALLLPYDDLESQSPFHRVKVVNSSCSGLLSLCGLAGLNPLFIGSRLSIDQSGPGSADALHLSQSPFHRVKVVNRFTTRRRARSSGLSLNPLFIGSRLSIKEYFLSGKSERAEALSQSPFHRVKVVNQSYS